MSINSAIEWTEATWNPVRGCTKVSPGCAHCYAETFAERWRGVPGHPYEQGFDLRLVPEKLNEPLTWRKPRRVFVNSMSDLFHEGVPDQFIDDVFAVMALAPEHTFQILTKRAERMSAYLSGVNRHDAIVAAMDMPSWLPAGRRFPRIPAYVRSRHVQGVVMSPHFSTPLFDQPEPVPYQGRSAATRAASFSGAVAASPRRGAKLRRLLEVIAAHGPLTLNEMAERTGWPLSSICSLQAALKPQLEAAGHQTVHVGTRATQRTRWKVKAHGDR